jgi:preprotein translocase subunit YajC
MGFLCALPIAMAQPGGAGGAQGDSFMSTIMLIVPMILIFYFFLIRPQSKRAKEHQKFLEGLKRGDKVVTNGGIWGKIAAVTDQTIDLEVSRDVKIRMTKGQIAGYQRGEAPSSS